MYLSKQFSAKPLNRTNFSLTRADCSCLYRYIVSLGSGHLVDSREVDRGRSTLIMSNSQKVVCSVRLTFETSGLGLVLGLRLGLVLDLWLVLGVDLRVGLTSCRCGAVDLTRFDLPLYTRYSIRFYIKLDIRFKTKRLVLETDKAVFISIEIYPQNL